MTISNSALVTHPSNSSAPAAELGRGFFRSSFPGGSSFLFAAALCSLSFSSAALASEDFPPALQEAAGTDCIPSCLTCHTTEPGVSGTATQPFAEAMKDAGLEGGDVDTVAPSYALVYADQQNPALPAEDVLDLDFPCKAEVLYGCGAQVAPESPRRNWGWLLVLGALAFPFVGRRVFTARKGD